MAQPNGSNVSYIDGVPVKISERYNPPAKISLPQKLAQCLANCQRNASNDAAEDAKTVAAFADIASQQRWLGAWRRQREQERDARRQRIAQRQIDRQRQIDEQHKQKLTAVSYDDLSSSSDDAHDDEPASADEQPADGTAGDAPPAEALADETASDHQSIAAGPGDSRDTPTAQQQRFDTILVPTVLRAQPDHHPNSWSFMQRIAQPPGDVNCSTGASAISAPAINWSDFESDTSSPFDNIELKSINDLDILAQVLNLNGDRSATVAAGDAPAVRSADGAQAHSQGAAASDGSTTASSSSTSTPSGYTPTQPQPIGDFRANGLAGVLADQQPPSGSPSQQPQLQQPPQYAIQYYHSAYAAPQPFAAYAGAAPATYQQSPNGMYNFNYQQQQLYNGGAHSYAGSQYGSPMGSSGSVGVPSFGPDAYKSTSVPDILRHSTTGPMAMASSGVADASMGLNARRPMDNSNNGPPASGAVRYF